MAKACWSLALFLAALAPGPARAQSFESIGIRAQGMGGAFVAVADDATASWWNPAGVARGAYFSAILEFDTTRQPDIERDSLGRPVPAWRASVRAFSASYPALALSYYRLKISEMRPTDPIGGGPAGRQDPGGGEVRLRSLGLIQFGATVDQSIGDHLVVGSTLKLVRGTVGLGVASGRGATLAAAGDVEGAGEIRGDLDVGALVTFGAARLGMTIKNVTRPGFGAGDDRFVLPRQVRSGVALRIGGGRTGEVTVAADADLTTTPTATSDSRRVAAGVEAWTRSRRFGVRGGVSADTIGGTGPSVAGGVSVAIRSGTFFDGYRAVGADGARQGWGVGLRVTY